MSELDKGVLFCILFGFGLAATVGISLFVLSWVL